MRRRTFLLGGAAAVSTACLRSLRTPTAWKAGPTPPASALAANPARDLWPSQVTAAPQKIQEAFRWAVANEPALRYIPCYCGCVGQGHRDNYDCYVAEQRSDGWLILSDHAFG